VHPVIAKITRAVEQLRQDNSLTLDVINISPADFDELGMRIGAKLFGVPVIPDPSRPRGSAAMGVTQERRAFDETKLGR
jgi:hypothetical protein